MTKLIVTHTVANFDTWKTAFDAHGSTRDAHGITVDGILRGAENPNEISVILQAGSPDKALEFLGSSELRGAMKDAGVTSQPSTFIGSAI